MIWQLDAKYFYYPHGPLARVEVGQEQVQAFDYAYTLHGWLKGVNTNTLVEGTDIGMDGQGDTHNPNRWFGRDAAGFSLGYYTGDYQAIGQNGGDFLNADLQNVYSSGSDLFNGNISHMVTAIHQQNNPPAFNPVPQATTYRYDRLNRIKEMKAWQGTVSSGVWTAQNTQTFASAYQYDFNGNITELQRYAGGTQIDDLEYFYNHDNHTAKTGLVSNKLYLVDEQATNVGGNDLKQGTLTGAGFNRNTPSTWNYNYDPIGNLIQDVNDSIDLISWTVTGKVSDVIFSSTKDDLTFRYDPMGNRIAKIQKPKNWTDEEEWTVTWYSRDAQGNVLAVYNKPENSTAFSASEFNIYGSSRIGMVTQPEELDESPSGPVAFSQTLGNKVYEFSNHLGNVLTTFSDRKIPTEGDPGFVAYYTSEILSSTDYYPFGFQMPGRVYEGDYRYGFNCQEKDDEVTGAGNSYTAEFWQYDPRIGRRWNIDPKPNPSISIYATFANNPVYYTDAYGDTIKGDEQGLKDYNAAKALVFEMKNFFQSRVDKIEKKVANKGTTFIRQWRLERNQRKLSVWQNVQCEFEELESSSTTYYINSKPEYEGRNYGGNLGYDYENEQVVVNYKDNNISFLAHELKHAFQYETRRFALLAYKSFPSTKTSSLKSDLFEEQEAYGRTELFKNPRFSNGQPIPASSIILSHYEIPTIEITIDAYIEYLVRDEANRNKGRIPDYKVRYKGWEKEFTFPILEIKEDTSQ